MRHVLLSSLGLSPAVVTETLWALLNPIESRHPVRCDVVHVITTAQRDADTGGHPKAIAALKEVAETLASSEYEEGYQLFRARELQLRQAIERLYAEHGHAPPDIVFEAVKDADGDLLADITTLEHNRAFADHVEDVMRYYGRSDDPAAEGSGETFLHVSLAGGRKSMSSNMQAQMTYFGRMEDQLTHVLVRPDQYERDPAFWWPGSNGVGSDAEVDLVTIPFVPLQDRLPGKISAKIVSLDGLEAASTALITDQVDGPEPVIIDLPGKEIRCRTFLAALTEQQTVLVGVLARARVEGWQIPGFEEHGTGWVAAAYPDPAELERVTTVIRRLHSVVVSARSDKFSEVIPLNLYDTSNDGAGSGNNFSGSLGRLEEKLRREYPYLAIRMKREVRTLSAGAKRSAWRLVLPGEQIVIQGDDRK